MKKITIILMLLIGSSSLFAQLGIGTVTPDSSSMLDISTTDKGLLIPRLTQSKRNAINNPAHSLIVFCVDCTPIGMYYYDTTNTSWTTINTDTQLDESTVDSYIANNGYLTSFTEVDGSVTNEIQTISRSGTTVTLSNNGGSFSDSVLTESQVDGMVNNNGYLTSFTEVDGSTTNEIQNIDLTNNTLSIDNANSVNLSSYLDNTDNQQISKSGTTVTLENGGSFTDSVLTETQVDAMVNNNGYLTSFTEIDGSTTNEIQNIDLTNNTLSIDNANSVDLSPYLDNTDNQQISKSGTTVTLESGGSFTDSVLTETQIDAMVNNNGYLTSFTEVDGSVTNEIQTISRSGTTVTLSNNGGTFTDSVLTEVQVDAMVNNNGYLTSFTEVDGSTTNEIQNIDLTNNTLSIDNANSVDLSSYLDNTDNQQISRSGTTVTLENGGSFTDSVLTETQVDAMVANNNYALGQILDTANGVVIPGGAVNQATDDFVFGSDALDATGKSSDHESRVVFDKSQSFFAAGNSTTQWEESKRGQYSAVFGENNEASGNESFVAGSDNTTSSYYSAVFGRSNEVTIGGSGSIVSGSGNDVNALSTAVSGSNNTVTAQGGYSAVSGLNNTVNELFTITSGQQNEVDGRGASAFGNGLKSKSYGEFVIGSYNLDYAANSISAKNNSDRLFVIGNGTSSSRSNAVTVLKGGEMGIGTSTPTHTLDVNGEGRFTDSLTIGNYTLPPSDGSANQSLTTDGNGNISWANDSVLTETQVDAMVNNNGYLTSFTEVDGSTTNEIQNLSLSGNNLNIDGANGVDLSSFMDNTDNQDLSLSGNTLSITNDPNTNVDLSTYLDNTDNQQISRSGLTVTLEDGGSFTDSVDNMGNHTATQNIELSDNWLSNDGGDEGIKIDDNGSVGINTNSPLAALHVDGSATVNGVPSLQAVFGAAEGNGFDGKIELRSARGSVTGSSGGVVLTNYDIGNDSTNVMGDMAIMGKYNTSNLGGIRFRTTADGTYANMTNALEIDKDQNINIPNGSLSVGDYTLPTADGTASQVLSTNGNGSVSWVTDADGSTTNEIQDLSLNSNTLSIENANSVDLSPYLDNTDNQSISRSGLTVTLENGGTFTDSVDNMGNHTATQNIQLNGNWISNDGGDEGINILDNGRVGIGTDSAHTTLHIGSSNTLNDVPSVYALFGQTEGSGILDGKIELRSNRTGVSNGEGGVVLTNFDNDISATKVMGDFAMMGEDNTNNLGGIRLRTSSDGTYANMTNALEVDKDQNINIPNGTLSVGDYTLPAVDGIENQVLSTDGDGNLSWEAAASMSNISLSYSFVPATHTNLYENYLGTFSCTDGVVYIELLDRGSGHGASNYYEITRDFGSEPVVTFHHDAVAGNGYVIHYRVISGCSYELFFEAETTTTATISFDANIKTSGTVDTTLSSSDDTNILACLTGVTVDRLGRVGISNTNPTEELDVTGDAAISGTLKISDYTLPAADGTANQILKTNGNGALSWIDNDLLNHTATQNIALNDNWISNGGGDNGIRILPGNGYVGINNDSALAALHVHGSATVNGITNLQAIFGSTQGSGSDGKIEVRSIRGNVTSSEGGVVLTNYDTNIDSTNVMGDMSILGTDNTNNLGGIRFRTTADGTYANMTSALEIDKDQNINIPNGNLTLGAITLPTTDGAANQVLKTDGNGALSWSDDVNTQDDLGNHIATANLQLNGNWISNDGDNEAIYISEDGNVGIGTSNPLAGLHVTTNTDPLNGIPHVAALFGNEVDDLQSIHLEIRGSASNNTSSKTGLVLSHYDHGAGSTNIMGHLAVLGDDVVNNLGGLRLRTTSDGTYAGLVNALEADKNQNINIPNGTLTIGDFELPSTDGSNNQVLKTDGNGNVSWANDEDTPGDNLGNHQLTQTLQTNTKWISGDGDAEGLRVVANGKVYSSGDIVVGNQLSTDALNIGNGSTIVLLQKGQVSASTSGSTETNVSITFDEEYNNEPVVTVGVYNTGNGTNTYSVTIVSISTTGATFRVRRLDGSSVGDVVKINWIAM